MPEKVTGDRKSYVTFSRVVMIFILMGMSIIALTISDVIVFVFDMASLLFVLAPVYIYAALNKPQYKNRKTDALVSTSIAISTLVYIYMFTNNMFVELIMAIVPAICSIILTSLSIYLGQKLASTSNTT